MKGRHDGWALTACGIMVLSCTMATVACPPPDYCPDCMVYAGYLGCVLKPGAKCSPYDGCGECCDCSYDCQCYVSTTCPPAGSCSTACVKGDGWCSCGDCWCWTPDTWIDGWINVYDTCLCNTAQHSVTAWDNDRWEDTMSGWNQVIDSLTYGWSMTTGTNCQTGTWLTSTTNDWVGWQAPPCIGTVVFTVTVDDVPDPAWYGCDDSDRDDYPRGFNGTVMVTLPDGCYEGLASFSVDMNTSDPGNDWCMIIDPACGLTIVPSIDCDINVVYNNCSWVFQVDIDINVQSGVCPPPGVVDISSGSDPFLTTGNYCDIVKSMRFSTGCLCVGSQRVTASDCAQQHEDKHLLDYAYWFNAGIEDIDAAIPDSIPVNCAEPSTMTCQDVKETHEAAIEAAVMDAHQSAYDFIKSHAGELAAISAALECFNLRADEICTHAQKHEWPACDACGGS